MPINKNFIYSAFNKLRRDLLLSLYRLRNPDAEVKSIFEYYFRHNLFGDRESLSGTGSSLSATETIRAILPDIVLNLQVRNLLDIPCGDFNWVKEINLHGCGYTGADIVEPLIQQNQNKYGTENRRFVVIDILNDPLPKADLVLCRDLFIHFPNEAVIRSLTAIKNSNAKYLITTNFNDETRNTNINFGSYRPINLILPPFSFPPPLEVIADEDFLKFRGKALCLWRIPDIPDF